MFRKSLMTLAAAGFAALTLAGAAEAHPRHGGGPGHAHGRHGPSMHFGGPGWSFHVGSPRHRHGYRHHRRNCRPIFRNQRVWTYYGWTVQRVKVGRTCGPRHRGHRGHRGWRW